MAVDEKIGEVVMNKNLVWIALGGLVVYFVFFKKENKQIPYDPSKDADNQTFTK